MRITIEKMNEIDIEKYLTNESNNFKLLSSHLPRSHKTIIHNARFVPPNFYYHPCSKITPCRKGDKLLLYTNRQNFPFQERIT